MEKPNILVVEDDGDISAMLVDLLEQNGYGATPAYSGTEALMRLGLERYDLVLLDLMLPGKSGREVLEELRAGPGAATPVIAVTAVGDTASKVDLLGNGADDYLTKPFVNEELIARIGVQLRKAQSAPLPEQKGGVRLEYGELAVDGESMSATAAGRPLGLTRRELLILQLLMSHPNKVFTKSNIYESVWGEEFWGDENTVNVHISNLRQKIARHTAAEYIQTVWGIGFKMKELA